MRLQDAGAQVLVLIAEPDALLSAAPLLLLRDGCARALAESTLSQVTAVMGMRY